jgi:predicted ester cyclase
MKKVRLNIFTPKKEGATEAFANASKQIEKLMAEGYEVEVKLLADGTRREVYKFDNLKDSPR